MKCYRLSLELLGAAIGPWHSDTIFGSLCWSMSYHLGQQRLEEFCQQYSSEPPLLVSNAFPEGCLPCPWIPSDRDIFALNKEERIEQLELRKQEKENKFVSLSDFNRILQGGEAHPDRKEPLIHQEAYHNQISRISGTTGEGGNLYRETKWFSQTPLDIYFKISNQWADEIASCLEILAHRGIGKRSNLGNGSFSIKSFEPFVGFLPSGTANAYLSLSNFVPDVEDPTEGYYQTLTKYSKHGGYLSSSPQPFKKPLLMFAAGSWFYCGQNKPKEYYGKMVKGLSLIQENNLHYGLAFALPMVVEKSAG